MTIDKLGNVGAGLPVPDTSGTAQAREAGTTPTDFKDLAAPRAIEQPAGIDGAMQLEQIVASTVEAVRRGEIDPGQALDRIIEGARPVVGPALPAEVDVEQALAYIKESLEQDPTFLSLLNGQGTLGV